MVKKNKKKQEEFNLYKELKIISLWIGIAVAVSGVSWKIFEVPPQFIPFITIIAILIIIIILQYKKMKVLEKKK